jgi:hypothetical protein
MVRMLALVIASAATQSLPHAGREIASLRSQ